MDRRDYTLQEQGIYDHRVELLFELIGKINTKTGVTGLLDSIMEACKTIMDAEAGSLMLLSSDENELVISIPTGPKKSEVSGRRIPVGRGISGWVARYHKPLIVNDAATDPRFEGELTTNGFTTRNLISVPMLNNEAKLIGVIQAINKKDGGDFGEDEIPLLMALANQAAICIEREYWYRKAIDRERMDEQMKMARVIQTGFFPAIKPGYDNIDIAGTSNPATYVGGDYFDYIKLGGKKWGIAVADVTGKGVPAAMLMATLRAQLRSLADQDLPAQDTVNTINSMLLRETGDDTFITLFYGLLDGNKLRYTNAGHNPPLLYDPETDKFAELTEGGPLLGFIHDPGYKEGTCRLEPGQVLVMYTDGITEAEDIGGNHFDEFRLKEVIRSEAGNSAEKIMNTILREVSEFRSGTPQSDDETIVVLKNNAV